MRLLCIEWQNFRRLPDAHIKVRRHLVLIGPNDSGKSSILRAVHLCIGMSANQLLTAVTLRDFTDSSLPLRLTVTLGELGPEERAGFPDEIDLGPPDVLRVSVTASVDPADPETVSVVREFPDSGRPKSPSRIQLALMGWEFVSATRSLIRELGPSGGSAIQTMLAGVDIGQDAAAIEEASMLVRNALDQSQVLSDLRAELSRTLSATLPRQVGEEDLRFRNESDLAGDVLRGVVLTISNEGAEAPISEQSDGVRAMSLLAVLSMSQAAAKIVGVDEPETHLHSSAQRAIGRYLLRGDGQKCIATHSAALVSQVDPMDIAVFDAARSVHQLPASSRWSSAIEVTRHWSLRLLEPLTARHIVFVEGPADRIILEGVARVADINLDRHGVAIFELDGAGFFATVFALFGPQGYDLPVTGLLDEDARDEWANTIGIDPPDIEAAGYVVCDPDLEGAYVAALGAERVLSLLNRAGIEEPYIRTVLRLPEDATIDASGLTQLCGHKKRKVRAALAIANGIEPGDLGQLQAFLSLLQRACAV